MVDSTVRKPCVIEELIFIKAESSKVISFIHCVTFAVLMNSLGFLSERVGMMDKFVVKYTVLYEH